MNRKLDRCIILILISCSVIASQLSIAQDIGRGETITNRARPELDALGIRMGAFLLFPELALSGVHNSNIFADDVDVISDSILVLSPSVELSSDWNRHAVKFGVDADIFRYTDFDSEDRENYSVWGEGRFEASGSRFVRGEFSHQRLHENRDSIDDVGGFEPTRYYDDQVSILYETARGSRQFYTMFAGEYREVDFENSFGASGLINNDDRDRSKVSGAVRVGYGLHSKYSIFLQGRGHSVKYDHQFDDAGFERSSTGYELALGTTLDFSGETFGDIFVGYLSETYDDPRFDKIDGPSFGAEVFWNLSGLTTVSLSGSREVEPTTTGETAGIEATRFRIGVDHELLRNMILSANLGASKEDFMGIDRQDDIRVVGFSARYVMNRWAELAFGYSYRRRNTDPSSNQGIEFSRNLFNLTVKGHL